MRRRQQRMNRAYEGRRQTQSFCLGVECLSMTVLACACHFNVSGRSCDVCEWQIALAAPKQLSSDQWRSLCKLLMEKTQSGLDQLKLCTIQLILLV